MTTKTYRVARAMTSDGTDYARGDKRDLSEGDAAPLVQSGALVKIEAAPDPTPAPTHAKTKARK